MKLTPAQFGVLHALDQFGSKPAVEVLHAPSMDGKRKVKLEWNGTLISTLEALEGAGLVSVARSPVYRKKNAVGKPGLPRRDITISITEIGRAALAVA